MLKNKKRIALMIAVLMLVLSFSTTGFASWLDKTIKASYRNITVFVNNTQKVATTTSGTVVEPFIVDGTTYVPLRGIAEMLGYQVTFNPTTYRIDIVGTDVAALAAQVIQKDARIKELETQLAKYSTVSLTTLRSELKADYTKIGTVSIKDIILKGDKSAIELQIYVDLTRSTDYNAWTSLSETTKKTAIQNMVDDIRDAFADAKITGFVQDNYDKSKILKFTLDTRDRVVLGSTTSIRDIAALEEALNEEFYTYNDWDFDIIAEKKTWGVYLDIETIYGKLPTSSSSRLSTYLRNVSEFILENYDSSIDIEGVIWDSTRDIEFEYIDGALKVYW
jgi:hypothetical protein